MKKSVLFILSALTAALLLSGCESKQTPGTESVKRVQISELLPEKAEPPAGSSTVEFENIKVTLPNAWRKTETDGSAVYYDDDKHCAYMFCGCNGDKWLSPFDLTDQYMEKLGSSAQLVQPVSEELKDKNGTKYQISVIRHTDGSCTDLVMLLFSPQNKLFWIFKGETIDDSHTPDIFDNLISIAKSAELVLPEKDEDVITGHTLSARGRDRYTVTFGKDGNYSLLYSRPYTDNDRLSGYYILYRGAEAIDYLTSHYKKLYTEAYLTSRIKQECRSYDDIYVIIIEVGEQYSRDGFSHTKSYERMFWGTRQASNGRLKMYDQMGGTNTTWTVKE